MDDNSELFKKALKFVLKWEGGYVNDPDDRGGATNKGITQGTYNGWLKSKGLKPRDVKNITDIEVAQIYYQNYWCKANCNNMSKVFAVLAFDTAVNMGISRVSQFLKAAQYKDPDKFLFARVSKYREFAKVPSQAKFLKGWINRTTALANFIKTL
jgi:lysozyme family protein